MIAYEELEKALARWKARRPEAMAAAGEAAMEDLGEATPMAREELEATSMGEEGAGLPTGFSQRDGAANDSTGELEIGDAVPEER